MKPWWQAREGAEALRIGARAFQKHAKKRNFNDRPVPNPKGGPPLKEYEYASMDADTQRKLIAYYRGQQLLEMEQARASGKELLLVGGALVPANGNGGGKPVLYDACGREIQTASAGAVALAAPENGNGAGVPAVMDSLTATPLNPYQAWNGDPAEKKNLPLNEDQLHEAGLKADLVFQYRKAYEPVKKWGRLRRAKKSFIDAYNRGGISTDRSSFPKLYAILKHVSLQAIERWDLLLERNKNDFLALADTRGRHRKGITRLTEEQKNILLKCVLVPGETPKSEAIRNAIDKCEKAGFPLTIGEAQLRRVIDQFERERWNLWVGIREGEKAHNEKCLPHVRRDWNRVKVGQVLIADGHKLNFEILCPYTGRPKRMTLLAWYDGRSNMVVGWEVMASENVFCVTSAFRRGLIFLGRWPVDGMVVILDNGRAFKARFFTGDVDFELDAVSGLYKRLGIKTIFAWPYHAESKPVEGFFAKFAELERRVHTSYVGTDIGKKPPRLRRGEKLHRELHERFFQGYVPNIFEAHELIADWLDEYAHRKQKSGHLKGQRPIEVFEAEKGPGLTPEQVNELNMMLMPSKVTTVKRDGIQLPGRKGIWYYSPKLFGRKMEVIVRHDWHLDSPVHVWDMDGNYICEALPQPHTHPAAKYLGNEEDQEELRRQIEVKKSLEKQTFGPARKMLKDEILPEVVRQIEAGVGRKPEKRKSPPERPIGPCDDRSKIIDLEPKRSEAEQKRIDRECQAVFDRHDAEERANADQKAHDEARAERDIGRYKRAQEAWLDHELTSDESVWMSIFEASDTYRRLKDEFEEYRMGLIMARADRIIQEGRDEANKG
jgi:putative transposase